MDIKTKTSKNWNKQIKKMSLIDIWNKQSHKIFGIKIVLDNRELRVDAVTALKRSELFTELFELDHELDNINLASANLENTAIFNVISTWYGASMEHLVNNKNICDHIRVAIFIKDKKTLLDIKHIVSDYPLYKR